MKNRLKNSNLLQKGIDENIVAESLYFLSVSYERQGNYSYAKIL